MLTVTMGLFDSASTINAIGGSMPTGTVTAIGGSGRGVVGFGASPNWGFAAAFCISSDRAGLNCENDSGVPVSVSSVGKRSIGCASGGLVGRPEGRKVSLATSFCGDSITGV